MSNSLENNVQMTNREMIEGLGVFGFGDKNVIPLSKEEESRIFENFEPSDVVHSLNSPTFRTPTQYRKIYPKPTQAHIQSQMPQSISSHSPIHSEPSTHLKNIDAYLSKYEKIVLLYEQSSYAYLSNISFQIQNQSFEYLISLVPLLSRRYQYNPLYQYNNEIIVFRKTLNINDKKLFNNRLIALFDRITNMQERLRQMLEIVVQKTKQHTTVHGGRKQTHHRRSSKKPKTKKRKLINVGKRINKTIEVTKRRSNKTKNMSRKLMRRRKRL